MKILGINLEGKGNIRWNFQAFLFSFFPAKIEKVWKDRQHNTYLSISGTCDTQDRRWRIIHYWARLRVHLDSCTYIDIGADLFHEFLVRTNWYRSQVILINHLRNNIKLNKLSSFLTCMYCTVLLSISVFQKTVWLYVFILVIRQFYWVGLLSDSNLIGRSNVK